MNLVPNFILNLFADNKPEVLRAANVAVECTERASTPLNNRLAGRAVLLSSGSSTRSAAITASSGMLASIAIGGAYSRCLTENFHRLATPALETTEEESSRFVGGMDKVGIKTDNGIAWHEYPAAVAELTVENAWHGLTGLIPNDTAKKQK